MQPQISAESTAPSEDDLRKRTLVEELIKSENKALAEFAKHLVTVSFSAMGIVLAMMEKWLTPTSPSGHRLLLVVAIVMFLGAAAVASLAASAFVHRVSLVDYDGVEAELQRVAGIRHRCVVAGSVLLLAAAAIVATVALLTVAGGGH